MASKNTEMENHTHVDNNLASIVDNMVVTFFCYYDDAPMEVIEANTKNVSFLNRSDYKTQAIPSSSHRYFYTLSAAAKNERSDCIFLDGESIKLLLFNLPQNASFVLLRLSVNRHWPVALLGLLRRLFKRELQFTKFISLSVKDKKQYWIAFQRVEQYIKSIENETNFPFSEEIGFEGLARYLNENDIGYTALIWDDVSSGVDTCLNTLNLLVKNDCAMKVRTFLKENPGNLLIKVRPVSRFEGIPYFPPPIARKIIDSAIKGPFNLNVPAPKESFLSFIYHVLYHKGEKAGISSTLTNFKVELNSKVDYRQVMAAKARELNINVHIGMESLDEYLAEQGWRPNLDTLNQLSADNRWITERFFSKESEEKGLGVLIVRERVAKDTGATEKLLRIIEKEGFVILSKRKFLPEELQYITDNTRGGNWDTKESDNLKDFTPAMAIVIFDAHQTISREFKENRRLRQLKEDIRKSFHGSGIVKSGSSVVHSTDNSMEAWEYVNICFPGEVGEIGQKIKQTKSHHKLGAVEKLLLATKFFTRRLQKSVVNTGKKTKNVTLSFLVRFLIR